MANLTKEEWQKIKLVVEDYIELLDPYDYKTLDDYYKEKIELKKILEKM